jgi:hypothetical protein
MTKAIDIIEHALAELGVLANGQPPAPEDSALGFRRLNSMVEAWAQQGLYANAVSEVVYSMTSNTPTLSIGPGGDIDVPRPVRLEDGAYLLIAGTSHPISVVNRSAYDGIGFKGTSAFSPDVVYYEATVPLGYLHFWPVMSGSGDLHLPLQGQITQFSNLTTSYTLPQGYERAMFLSLACELARPFGRVADPSLIRDAANARRGLKRANVSVPLLDSPFSGWDSTRAYLFGGAAITPSTGDAYAEGYADAYSAT